MIKVDVEEYCENCENFEPEAQTLTATNCMGEKICNTTVKCRYRTMCKRVHDNLRENFLHNYC